MDNVVKISGFDQRSNKKSVRESSEKDRRKDEYQYLTIDQLDFLYSHFNNRYLYLVDLIKDKEKKKLTIIVSSFAVFSLLVTYMLSTFKGIEAIEKVISFPFLVISLVFLSSISVINVSIIKYIVSLKQECLLAIRQLNCIRQAINSTMFARLEGYIPRTLTEEMVDKKDFDRTIIDTKTKYWDVYGRHEKYPLNNVHLRKKYQSWRFLFLWFTSSDIFAVSAISMFTVFLISAPITFFIREIETLQSVYQLTMTDILAIGAISVILLIGFISLVTSSIFLSLLSIKKALNKDDTITIEPKDNKIKNTSI